MMFLLAYVWIRLERLVVPFLKPFHALAGTKSAQSAMVFIVSHTFFVSRLRTVSSHKHRVPAPAPARRAS
jgi:hypothetical protein